MKKRLIDASAVEAKIEKNFRRLVANQNKADLAAALSYVGDLIIDAPTVEAVEVVHGRWLYDSGSGKYFCSACDEYALSFKKDTLYGGDLYEVCLTDYCPNCGADMRERKCNA